MGCCSLQTFSCLFFHFGDMRMLLYCVVEWRSADNCNSVVSIITIETVNFSKNLSVGYRIKRNKVPSVNTDSTLIYIKQGIQMFGSSHTLVWVQAV